MDNKAQSTRRRTCTCGVGEAQCAHETSVCTTTNPGGNPGFVVFVPTTKASLLGHDFCLHLRGAIHARPNRTLRRWRRRSFCQGSIHVVKRAGESQLEA